MTVSGLGPARAMRAPITPPNRPPRAERNAREKRDDHERLTAADRGLIFQVTGERVGPGRPGTTGFAAALAAERAAGRLAIGQEVTAVYLKDLNRRYERAPGPNPLDGHLDKAITVLTRGGARRIDVTA
jgi:hypothetical protein